MTEAAPPNTRDRLVLAAAHLFARRGIEEVPLRDIVAEAGQRNASAVHYYFGNRWGLVIAILEYHDDLIRGTADEVADLSVPEIADYLVDGLLPTLATSEGRDLVQMFFELMARFAGRWENQTVHPGFNAILERVAELRPDLPRDVARWRAVIATQMVTNQMAERARIIDEDMPASIDLDEFAANLKTLALVVLSAPRSATPAD
jgi:AcrR family transcriptional regulator